ncbi:MAG: hypothetical protein R3313_04550 [Candidatus Saccharimonadales bacterium]|nr:hypothetical protein [Candidatus Saccharimonadales bacterium]
MEVKKTSRSWLVVLVAAAIALVLTILFLLRSPTSEYSESLRSEFVSSCTASAQNEAYCICSYQALQERLSAAEFEALDRRMKDGATTQFDIEVLSEVAGVCTGLSTNP